MTANPGRAASNQALHLLLTRADWSPESLGSRLNELATALGLRAHVHRRSPRRWVNGNPSKPGHASLGSPGRRWCATCCTSGWASRSPRHDGLAGHRRVAVRDDEPAWVYWFTEAELEGVAGRSLLEFGRPGEAEPHLRRAVMLLGPSFIRDRALRLSDLATARAGAGDVERACATASEAATLMRRLESPRDQRRLTRFRQAAAPYAQSSAVREFDSKYRDLLGPATA